MRRRHILTLAAAGTGLLAGCTRSPSTPTPAGQQSASPTATTTPSGDVDNHRITDATVVSHGANRRDGRWVVTVTLDLKPVGDATPYPIGLFFYFFDAEGDELHEAYEQVPANTSGTTRTVTRSAELDTDLDAFARYRIDVVHA
jgi:hypothetical protein